MVCNFLIDEIGKSLWGDDLEGAEPVAEPGGEFAEFGESPLDDGFVTNRNGFLGIVEFVL